MLPITCWTSGMYEKYRGRSSDCRKSKASISLPICVKSYIIDKHSKPGLTILFTWSILYISQSFQCADDAGKPVCYEYCKRILFEDSTVPKDSYRANLLLFGCRMITVAWNAAWNSICASHPFVETCDKPRWFSSNVQTLVHWLVSCL